MRKTKSTGFSSIPTVPSTLAGQWLTFTHMANHYRKLLNVKPRVDSCAPKTSSTQHLPFPYGSIQGSPKLVKKRTPGSNVKTGPRRPVTSENNPNSFFHDIYNSNNNDTRPLTSASQYCNQNSDYHIVFGPSSLRSSVDALHSDDMDSHYQDQQNLSPVGVAEKIRRFLDHVDKESKRPIKKSPNPTAKTPRKSNASSNLNPSSPPTRNKIPGSPRVAKVPIGCSNIPSQELYQHQQALIAFESLPIDLKLGRHSKCFIPTETKVKKSTQSTTPSKKKTTTASGASTKNISKSSKPVPKTGASNNTQQIELKNSRTIVRKRRVSGGSMASIGTIHGSDELIAEVPYSPRHNPIGSAYNSRWDHKDSLSQSSRPSHNNFTGMSRTISMTSLNVATKGAKDSSRDSAYGFSSGESRITTRESTPEKNIRMKSCMSTSQKDGKKGQFISTLSTVESSINQDYCSSSRALSNASIGFHDWNSPRENREETKYINFLTQVTDDIVQRGVYTNKGLKQLFSTHLDKNRDKLEVEKMTTMIEKLRLDLGIPKDDDLNKIEFGYGSVSHSDCGYYFYKRSESEHENCCSDAETYQDDPNESQHQEKNLISPLKHRKSIEDNLNRSNNNNNNETFSNASHNGKDESCGESTFSSESSLSANEDEIKNALLQVGLSSKSTTEIVNIVMKGENTEKRDGRREKPKKMGKS